MKVFIWYKLFLYRVTIFTSNTNKETTILECFYIIEYVPRLNQCRFEVKNIFVQYSCTHSTTLNMQVSNNTFFMHDVSVDIFCLLSVKRLFIDFWIFIFRFKWMNSNVIVVKHIIFNSLLTWWLFITLPWSSNFVLNMY